MANSIAGKVVVITGASSGLGEATARHLSVEGARVALGARRVDRLQALAGELTRGGGKALAVATDVTRVDQVKALVDAAVQAYGRIDVMINNAGLMPQSLLERLKIDEWDRMVDVNIKGVLNSTAAALPYLKQRGKGHVINTSSIAGRKVFPGLGVYCATKHAIAAFSEALRLEVAPKHDIRVTCIQPGAVDTELFEHITDGGYRQQMEGLRSQMTFLSAAEIADTVLFAVQAPAHVNVAELFVLPTNQPW